MTPGTNLSIGEAKGRPMLHWVGKRPLDHVTAYPAQLIETFNPTGDAGDAQGLLFHGDNKDILAWLLANGYRGKVDLIYIDPPFDSGADYVRTVDLRSSGAVKLSGQPHSLGEQIQYADIWLNDMYLQFMYERFLLIKELLSETGSSYVHCDWRMNSYLRLILDEVFGKEMYRSEVKWKRVVSTGSSKAIARRYPVVDDSILFYTKGDNYQWNTQYTEFSAEYKSRYTEEDERGRFYWDNLGTYSDETLKRLINEDRIKLPLVQGRNPRYKNYLHERKGVVVDNLWTDIVPINSQAIESRGYPTQKPEALLERIILASSDPGSLVLDCFAGSGTTAAVAQKLGRRWIAADINKGAIQTTSKRLQTIIREQIEAGATPHQPTLGLDADAAETPPPAALAFSIYRVNDYDLQIQHNEAVALVVEHLGIDRTRTDTFFDGTRGTRLVKIIPFNHPLTLLDLQALTDELRSRPDEDRDILVVCLGKETAVDPWLDDYNRRHPINKIDLIELRTDQKYGEFLVHEPAQAEVAIRRQGDDIVIDIVDFISPTIVKRLEMDVPLFRAQIPDWRAMVDVVLIDTAYDGDTFNIALSDVPERKDDLVQGTYRLPAPDRPTAVAVKIIDMLGEEVLMTAEV